MSSQSFTANLQSKMQMAQDVKDEDKLYRYNGILYPRIMCPEEHLKALGNITAREDDVMLVAYPKCGEWLRSRGKQDGRRHHICKRDSFTETFGPAAVTSDL